MIINIEPVQEYLIETEGFRNYAYQDHLGNITIGVGRNIQEPGGKGLTDLEVILLLNNDIQEVISDLKTIFPQIEIFTPKQQLALIDMRFNLGPKKFRSFKRTIASINNRHWEIASEQILQSKAAQQLPKRYLKISRLILNQEI